ncbi:putative endonuclease [Geobacter sp. OR-1]|uniref:thermonuclease family protein n=1 Tax=Geobacter sp. OR-1 TaxID=1266765 RepID=UPI000542D2A4|nr:thermonuclease family protein [Geobacter sp. OR-1]GAM11095.1 putative endonuclease [Geobacter sp. OR-1]
MKRLLLPLLFTFLAMPAYAKEPVRIIEVTVTKVSDGDTVHVTDKAGKEVKVRLYGIDAPQANKTDPTSALQSKGQPYGEEASKALLGKLSGKVVRLDVMGTGKNEKLIAIVWLGKRNINLEMVAEGWAWAHRQYLDKRDSPEYIKLEENARLKRLGLWQQSNPQPPWEFRKIQNIKGLL